MSLTNYAIPDNLPELTTTSTDFIDGLTTYGAAAGIVQNTPETIQADLDRAVAADVAYEAARAAATPALRSALRKADAAGRTFIAQAKKPLSFHLGDDWSERWRVAGFGNGTTQAPRKVAEREQLLADLAKYFQDNPGHEVSDFEVNAARANQLHADLKSARSAVDTQKKDQKDARSARDKAITNLRKRLRATISELDLRLDADSLIWAAVGLTPPAQKVRARREKAPAPAPAASTPASRTTAVEKIGVALAR